jgi:hypothetical protein
MHKRASEKTIPLATESLPEIVPERLLRKRWAQDRERSTWWRWKKQGKIPPADIVLPNGEDAWYRETVFARERAQRDAA